MKRSKWCKYCHGKLNCFYTNNDVAEGCIIAKGHDIYFSQRVLQRYRDSMAKRIKKLRKCFRENRVLVSPRVILVEVINCAHMLDQEKSAKVAARVQEIKEWRKQHG